MQYVLEGVVTTAIHHTEKKIFTICMQIEAEQDLDAIKDSLEFAKNHKRIYVEYCGDSQYSFKYTLAPNK